MKTLLLTVGALGLLYFAAPGHSAPVLPATPAAAAAPVATGPVSAADQALFTKLAESVGAAIEKKDMKALGELMAPDYIHYNPNNHSGRKADELAFLATWPPTTVKLVGPVQVSRSGNMAVSVSQHVYSSTDKDGKLESHTMQHMIAWTLSGGKWQMAIVQSKEVPA